MAEARPSYSAPSDVVKRHLHVAVHRRFRGNVSAETRVPWIGTAPAHLRQHVDRLRRPEPATEAAHSHEWYQPHRFLRRHGDFRTTRRRDRARPIVAPKATWNAGSTRTCRSAGL